MRLDSRKDIQSANSVFTISYLGLEPLEGNNKECKTNTHVTVDTGRKLNVHKMFRRRPGRLLNVLCTFNLGPVSTGVHSHIDLNENLFCLTLTL